MELPVQGLTNGPAVLASLEAAMALAFGLSAVIIAMFALIIALHGPNIRGLPSRLSILFFFAGSML
jgi:hypothetical protein